MSFSRRLFIDLVIFHHCSCSNFYTALSELAEQYARGGQWLCTTLHCPTIPQVSMEVFDNCDSTKVQLGRHCSPHKGVIGVFDTLCDDVRHDDGSTQLSNPLSGYSSSHRISNFPEHHPILQKSQFKGPTVLLRCQDSVFLPLIAARITLPLTKTMESREQPRACRWLKS